MLVANIIENAGNSGARINVNNIPVINQACSLGCDGVLLGHMKAFTVFELVKMAAGFGYCLGSSVHLLNKSLARKLADVLAHSGHGNLEFITNLLHGHETVA